jgi:hypothetical protein
MLSITMNALNNVIDLKNVIAAALVADHLVGELQHTLQFYFSDPFGCRIDHPPPPLPFFWSQIFWNICPLRF